MRKGLILVLVAASGFLYGDDRTGAAQCTLAASPPCPFPNLVAIFGGRVSPQGLSTTKYAPVSWGLFGQVSTRDGTHPPALREVVLNIDKDVRINSRDYPVCQRRRIEGLNSEAAARACAGALVGRGEATVELAFPESTAIPLSSRLLVFNVGERSGVTKLLIHTFIPIPVPTAILTVVSVSRQGSGLQMIAKIPVIAEGYGSLRDFKLKLGKTYSYKGKKVGYIEAKCPDGVFKANVSRLLFRNEAKVPGVAAQTVLKAALAVPCTGQS